MEIYKGVTSDKMVAEYFDDGALTAAPYQVYQLNSKGGRYYYTNEGGKTHFYPSVTTILSEAMPADEYLVKWIASQGWEQAENYKNERAKYGSFMHTLFAELIINKVIDLDGIDEKLKNYIEVNQLPSSFYFNVYDLKKDVLAFAQWYADYDVEPLAVELPLVCKSYTFAGTIDFVCKLRPTPKAKEKVVAIVDFKSGRNGFHAEHAAQLHLYKKMFEENFGATVEKLYNFSPKDWRKNPTYNFQDQTENENKDIIFELLKIGKLKLSNPEEKSFISCGGLVKLGVSLADNISNITLADIVARAHSTAETEETAEETAPETNHETNKKEVKNLNNILDF